MRGHPERYRGFDPDGYGERVHTGRHRGFQEAPAADGLRVGDAERDRVAEALHEHFAAGRLTREELEERLGAALAARTAGELRPLVRDLPEPHGLPGRAGYGHPRRPRHHRGPVPALPFLLAVFLLVMVTAGPGPAVFAVFQLALLAWVLRAVFLTFARRSPR